MRIGSVECKKEFLMENGVAAFRVGCVYGYRFAEEFELKSTGCEYVMISELGKNHYVPSADFETYFE